MIIILIACELISEQIGFDLIQSYISICESYQIIKCHENN